MVVDSFMDLFIQNTESDWLLTARRREYWKDEILKK